MRTLRVLGAALLLSAVPLISFAQTTDASSLVAQIAALEQEIQAITSGQSSVAASPPTVSPQAGGACPNINGTLSLGESGPDVSSLQAFLSSTGFFNNAITGYFGLITQSSVAAWQEMHGVVSGGNANSTGLGVVGPHTRAAIEASCGQGASAQNSCLPAQQPTSHCSTGWQPVAGANGCTAYYQCSVPIPGAATTTATSSTGTSQSCPVVPQPACNGSVVPFQTNSNGCVISYECVL